MATHSKSKSNIIVGGLFVVSLLLLLFLLNGDNIVLSWISSTLGQYVTIVEQVLAYVAVGGFAVIAVRSEGIRRREIGITGKKFILSLPVLIALGITTIAIAWYGNKLPHLSVSTQSGLSLSLPTVIFIVMVVSSVEEYIFRGYVQIGTSKHFGILAGIVVSSAVFAIAHIPSDISTSNPNSIADVFSLMPSLAFSAIGRFSFGLMAFAALYQVTGNLFIVVFTHAFYDFTVVYYTPVGGSLSIVLVCLVIPFVVVGFESLLVRKRKIDFSFHLEESTSAP